MGSQGRLFKDERILEVNESCGSQVVVEIEKDLEVGR